MEQFVWRTGAKIIAIVDIVLLCLGVLLLAIILAIYAGGESLDTDLYWFIGIIVAVSMLVVGLQLLAAVKLLRATKDRQDPKAALQMALFWRNVTVVFLVLTIVGQLINRNILGLVFTIVWKFISLHVVRRYTEEIETFLKTPHNTEDGGPDSVLCDGKAEGQTEVPKKLRLIDLVQQEYTV